MTHVTGVLNECNLIGMCIAIASVNEISDWHASRMSIGLTRFQLEVASIRECKFRYRL